MSLKQAKKDNKLSPKYYGPYKVLQKIGTMAYKLELPAYSRVHPVFHVSCLKKVIGDKIPVQTILLELDEEGKIILEPEAITDTRIRQHPPNVGVPSWSLCLPLYRQRLEAG
jgi:hypothetical protein